MTMPGDIIKKKLFVAYTPYHIFLSCILARSCNNSCELILVPDFPSSDKIISAILNWSNNPFKKIYVLRGKYAIQSNFVKIINIRKNLKIIKKQIRDKEAIETYVFNDANAEGQFIAFINHFNGGENTYVEDGASAYTNESLTALVGWKYILAKYLYGRWFKSLSVIGTSAYIDNVMVFNPDVVRNELQTKKIIAIYKHLILNFDEELRNEILCHFNINDNYASSECILLLPLSTIFKDSERINMISTYKKIIFHLMRRFKSIVCKYHPREVMGDYLSLADLNVKQIPHTIPVEIFFMIIKSQSVLIIGDISTALITAKMIMGDKSRVISIKKLIYDNNIDISVFEKMNIDIVDDIELI